MPIESFAIVIVCKIESEESSETVGKVEFKLSPRASEVDGVQVGKPWKSIFVIAAAVL
jgi:hypothetical protein